MYKGQQDKRKAYMEHINRAYGVKIEEFRQPSQKCGYFHITFPIFIKSQEAGTEPVGFKDPITEYTECKMKQIINKKLFEDQWYQNMCLAWKNNQTIIEETQELTHIEREKKWAEQ